MMSSAPDHRVNQIRKNTSYRSISSPSPSSNEEKSLLSRVGRISLFLNTAIRSVAGGGAVEVVPENEFSSFLDPSSLTAFKAETRHGNYRVDLGYKSPERYRTSPPTSPDTSGAVGLDNIAASPHRNGHLTSRREMITAVSASPRASSIPPAHSGASSAPHQQKAALDIVLNGSARPPLPTTLPHVPEIPSELRQPERPWILHAANTGLQGLSSLSGKKNRRVESLNEDAGSLCEVDVEDPDRKQKYHVRVAWIFDGHGPRLLDNVQSPGKVIAHAAINAHQMSIAKHLSQLIRTPVYPPDHPDFLTRSRQAIFSETFNETQTQVQQLLPPAVTKWAGSTATVLLAIEEEEKPTSPVSVMCSNFGDSRAIALTLRYDQNKRLIPENVFTLTAEENVRTQREKEWVLRECLHHGYRQAKLNPDAQSRNPPLRLVMVPKKTGAFDISSFEPFSGLEGVEAALKHARSVLPPKEQYSVYALQSPYLWKFNSSGHEFAKGLQVTGSIGDSHLEPIKKSTRSAKNVSVMKLVPDEERVTLLIVASDGLWDAVDKLPNRSSTFAHYIADHINQIGQIRGAHQILSDDLTRWAASKERDDVTVAVLGYPGMNVMADAPDVYDCGVSRSPSPVSPRRNFSPQSPVGG